MNLETMSVTKHRAHIARKILTLIAAWHDATGSKARTNAYHRLHAAILFSDLEGEYAHATLTLAIDSGLTITIRNLGGSGYSERMIARFGKADPGKVVA